MAYKRKNEIPPEQLEIIKKIGERVKQLRQDKKLSIERFCARNDIPRITYGNLEASKGSFQITTLLSVLKAHEMDLPTFFSQI